MSRVIIVPCDSYDEKKVYTALKKGVAELGGLEKFIRKDEKILVKPNYLALSDKTRPITTHRTVISGFLRLLNENAYENVKCGDSPAMASSAAVAASIGLSKADYHGATPAAMNEDVSVKNPDGRSVKELSLCREAVEADAVIGLCKMKTHAFMGITGAVKNMYGLVCGKRKGLWHVKHSDPVKFATMLADIHIFIKPRFHIMDAVVAMEGNGPASGDPVNMGLLLFSDDPVAIDAVFCYLTGINEKCIMTNIQGARAKIGTYSENEIEIILADENGTSTISRQKLFERFGKPGFKADIDTGKIGIVSRLLRLEKRLARKPGINNEKCIRCGRCVAACPVSGGAVHFADGKDNPPSYDYKKCIRCYCCQEVCPEKAIFVR